MIHRLERQHLPARSECRFDLRKRGTGLLVSSLDRMRPMPGDAIVVPEDLTRTTLTKDLKDWTQIFYQFGLGAAALKVISRP